MRKQTDDSKFCSRDLTCTYILKGKNSYYSTCVHCVFIRFTILSLSYDRYTVDASMTAIFRPPMTTEHIIPTGGLVAPRHVNRARAVDRCGLCRWRICCRCRARNGRQQQFCRHRRRCLLQTVEPDRHGQAHPLSNT